MSPGPSLNREEFAIHVANFILLITQIENIGPLVMRNRPVRWESRERFKSVDTKLAIEVVRTEFHLRRNERLDTRSRITVQNGLVQKGEGKIVWDHFDTILEKLGAGGMSSDESDVDDDGQRVYWVKKMSWRRKGLTARMVWIDKDRNTTTAYNNIRPGNPPRNRKRRINATETSRTAIPGLPINFYEEEWYNRLSEVQKSEINAAPAFELLEVQRVQ
ncbi:hypothetical protein BDZ97DRAFT_1935152 [Flammula alnicola]|nr:hypothetical protein BDZ97DRAFT_1935152 [Flammula alnicola]